MSEVRASLSKGSATSGTAQTELEGAREKPPRKITWSNVGVGGAIQVFEVCTLGQPFEVLKTHMAGESLPSLRSPCFL